MRDIKESEFWLEGAKLLLLHDVEDKEKYTVVTAMCIHSIIKANDYLCAKYLCELPTKHDQASVFFFKLIQSNKIPSVLSNFRKDIIDPAIRLKASVDYKGSAVSKSEAERWIRNAEKFLAEASKL